jgi:TolA-binding protein
MADILRQSEENGNRLRGIEDMTSKMRSDHEQRLSVLEQRLAAAAAAAPVTAPPADSGAAVPAVKPRPQPPKGARTTADTAAAGGPETAAAVPATDPGEDAYTEGFRLWQAGQYDQAITSLRAFISAYPKHHRVSWANNLVGRAMLDKGEARAATAAFLANYRNNPEGERAQDSLYYLGQALMKLGQPGQACKAYAELDAVYGAKVRPDLKKLETDAKTQAQCR